MVPEIDLVIIRNEFAIVKVSYSGNNAKALVLTDVNTGASISLDALELEVLTRIDREKLRTLIPE